MSDTLKCFAINVFGEGGHPSATPENLQFFGERYVRQCLRKLVGKRVRLTHAVDRFPDFIAPAGLTGIVVESTTHNFSVRMDAPLEGAEEWNNEVCWNLADDGQDDPLGELEPL